MKVGALHMLNDNYNKAYKEVLEILKHIPTEDVDKIPNNMLEMFRENQDKTYDFKIDTSIPFEEQSLLEETEAILANIFRDYWSTPYQRERILAKENYDREQLEKQKRELYNPDTIFKNKNKDDILENIDKLNALPIEVKKKNFFEKLISFIKKVLHKK